MWTRGKDAIPYRISADFEGTWYGIWSEGRYFIGRSAEDSNQRVLEKYIIPTGTYAAFTSDKGGYAGIELPKLREQIFNQWLPDSGYRLKDNIEIEIYHLSKFEKRQNRYYEIWIPLEQTADRTRD